MHQSPIAARPGETNGAARRREQGIVVATTHIIAGMKLRAPLPDDNTAGLHELAAKSFHAQHLRVRVATVLG